MPYNNEVLEPVLSGLAILEQRDTKAALPLRKGHSEYPLQTRRSAPRMHRARFLPDELPVSASAQDAPSPSRSEALDLDSSIGMERIA